MAGSDGDYRRRDCADSNQVGEGASARSNFVGDRQKYPSFLLRGSDEEARAMAEEADVESVDSLGAADELIENVTMNPWE